MMNRLEEMAWEVTDDTVLIEQDSSGNVDRVALHVVHVRLLAEEMGILKGGPDAARQVATLERRMRVLVERIDTLDTMILRAAEKGREDLTEECAYSTATWAIASEWSEDLGLDADGMETQAKPTANPAPTQRASVGAQGDLLEVRQ